LSIRVHILAKELGVNSKAILDKCRAEGLDVKNHMTVLSAGLEATIREWFSEGDHGTTEETTARVNLEKLRTRRRKRVTAEGEPIPEGEADMLEEYEEGAEEEAFATEGGVEPEVAAPTDEPVGVAAEEAAPAKEPVAAPTGPETAKEEPVVMAKEEPPVQESRKEEPVIIAQTPAKSDLDVLKPAARVELPSEPKAKPQTPPAQVVSEPVKEAPKPAEKAKEEVKAPAKKAEEPAKSVTPVGPMNVPAPAVMRGPRVVRVEKPEFLPRPIPSRESAPRTLDIDVASPGVVPGSKVAPKKGKLTDAEEEAKAKKAKNRLNPRRGKVTEAIEQLKEWRDKDLIERSQRLAQASDFPTTVRRAEPKKSSKHVAATNIAKSADTRKGKIQINEPIILKDFCSAIGVPFSKLFPKLMANGIPATINQNITAEQAELLAIDLGIDVEVIRSKSQYEGLVEQFQKLDRNNKERRSPIVTFLGHVDHGKTSLLDRIRHARVAAGEAGGITQHIGAYRCPIKDRFVVFLDTPGHEAFTALRARGAQMTDIVVLVVAADDGVMPQTKEAISHAKAAGVPIVVAMNKIDLPNADQNKALGQLSENGLFPTEWGGDVDIIRTSAATGEGIDQLVEHLNTLADLLDLKADKTGPATGLVIEAHQDPNRGTIADIMVQEGTLNISDILIVGGSYGRVRAMFDDTGKQITQAGPATPVEVLGLDQIPEAGDRFYVTDDMQVAMAIADNKRQENRFAYLNSRPKVTLENIFQQVETGQVHHLNLIVKTDTQGSLDVLRNKLTELGSSEVKVRVLHTAVGAITEGDVILAEASDAIILGFGVVADDQARNKAKLLDVEIRTYTVIYHLLEDITSALEGMLTPTFEQKVLGRATVRDVFRITRVGSVAGCLVTEGVIERSAKIRIIRQNVIIREQAALESLKRFKDDAREVRQGLECGIKIAGFDDIKEGDIIEAYQQVEVTRKLQPAGSE
jgi:translation initiation factor IF-2